MTTRLSSNSVGASKLDRRVEVRSPRRRGPDDGLDRRSTTFLTRQALTGNACRLYISSRDARVTLSVHLVCLRHGRRVGMKADVRERPGLLMDYCPATTEPYDRGVNSPEHPGMTQERAAWKALEK